MSDSGFERIASGAGTLFFLAAIVLFVTLIFLATGTVRAQEIPYSLSMGGWSHAGDHTARYLPYYDPDRLALEAFYPCFHPGCHGRRYSGGDWYPWTFRWGRYDVPSDRWWTFGEGFFDEYGTGGIWTASDPRKTTELKAIQTVERERMAIRMRNEAPRITGRRGMGSTGISASRGSSIGSSGGGSSIGSSGGGGRSGKK